MYNPNDYTRGMGGTETLTLEKAISRVMRNVYGWMAVALAITAVVAMGAASMGMRYIELVYENQALLWIPIIAEVGIVLFVSMRLQKLSFATMAILLSIYSALNGWNLASIFFIYTEASIASTFLVCAGTFAVVCLIGYTTKTNMASWGKYFMMALIGIVIASVVNIFVASEGLYNFISYAGVLLFVGLTAYDSQKIKHMVAINYQTQEMDMRKLALWGSLSLYLDFINLFIYLLRIMGSRRD